MPPSLDAHRDAVVMEETLEAASADQLQIQVPGGRIRLRPQPGANQLLIHGYIPDSDPAEAQAAFDRRGITARRDGARLHVHSDEYVSEVDEWRRLYGQRKPVHLDLHIPKHLDVDAQVPGGRVEATGLSGRVELHTSGGAVEASELTGAVSVTGGGGSIELTECSCPSLDLRWTSGTVALEHIRTDDAHLYAAAARTTLQTLRGPLKAVVHGAPLTLRNIEGPCTAQVSGGALTYQGTPQHDLSLTAVGAPLTTQLSASTAAKLVLSGSTAQLDKAFPFEGEKTPGRIEGRLGAGGPTLHLRALSGPVRCEAQ